MKNITRKILILGLLVGSMGIVACGGNSGNGGKSSGPASSTPSKKGPWTVKFDTNGGAETYEDQIIENKGTVNNPGTPTKVDPVKGTYTFIDWRCEGAAWSFSGSQVTANITLVANWLDKFAVDYKDASGAAIGTTSYINCGEPLTKPADPQAPAGKEFYGWINVKNGGQIWDYSNEQLNKVMDDVELHPLFVDSGTGPQVFEAEECPDFTYDSWGPGGMPGATWSGGQWGLALISYDYYDASGKNKYGASGDYTVGSSKVAGFVHFMYVNGDTLTWELESSEAASNVTLLMRLSAEYGKAYNPLSDEVSSWVDGDTFPITVNGTKVPYSKVNLRNIGAVAGYDYIPFQDYFVSASLSLVKGKNTIQMKVDNTVTLNGTVASSAPIVDCIKLFSSSEITWPGAMPENIK